MTTLRRRASDWLMDVGARLALDTRDMWRRSERDGTAPTSGDLQALFVLDVLSSAAIRLGRIVMPARPPDC